MMKPTLLLRIAALISALFAAGHFAGGLQQWNPMGANPVFASMTSQHFPVDGGSRSYLDLYLGLGWSTQVFLVLQTVILWMMASLARSDPARVRPMIGAFAIATGIGGLVTWRFILLVPAIFSLVLFIPLALAFVAARPARH